MDLNIQKQATVFFPFQCFLDSTILTNGQGLTFSKKGKTKPQKWFRLSFFVIDTVLKKPVFIYELFNYTILSLAILIERSLGCSLEENGL